MEKYSAIIPAMIFSIRSSVYVLALVLAFAAWMGAGVHDEDSLTSVLSVSDLRVVDGDLNDDLDVIKPELAVVVRIPLNTSSASIIDRSISLLSSFLPESRAPPRAA